MADFSRAAREVLIRSNEEAVRLDHSFIGSEHLFLALIEGDEDLARLVAGHGITPERFRDSVRIIRSTARGAALPPGEDLHLNSRAKVAVERGVEATQRLKTEVIETAHLMLGVLNEADGVVAGIFAAYGVDQEQIADQVRGSVDPKA